MNDSLAVGRAGELTGGPEATTAPRPSLPLLIGLIALGVLAGVGLLLSGGDLTPFGLLALIPLAGMIWYRPVFGVYLVLAAALVLEQYTIDGLTDPVTLRIPFFANIGGTEGWNVWTHENLSWLTANLLVLFLGWTALALFVRERKAHRLHIGRLGLPLLLFLAAMLFSSAWGLAQGGDFKVVLWEIRAPFYMGICYLLAVNLIRTSTQVRIAGWIVIIGIGI